MGITRPEDASKRADETTNLAVIENYMGFEYLAALFTVLSDSLGLKVLPSLWSPFYQMLKSEDMHLSMNVFDLKLAFQFGAAGAYGMNYNTYNLERLMHWCFSYIESKQTRISRSHEISKIEGSNVDLSSINANVMKIGAPEIPAHLVEEAREKMEKTLEKYQEGPYLSLKDYCTAKGIDYQYWLEGQIKKWTTDHLKVNDGTELDLSAHKIKLLYNLNVKEGLIQTSDDYKRSKSESLKIARKTYIEQCEALNIEVSQEKLDFMFGKEGE